MFHLLHVGHKRGVFYKIQCQCKSLPVNRRDFSHYPLLVCLFVLYNDAVQIARKLCIAITAAKDWIASTDLVHN
jgi:hypothetical protein